MCIKPSTEINDDKFLQDPNISPSALFVQLQHINYIQLSGVDVRHLKDKENLK